MSDTKLYSEQLPVAEINFFGPERPFAKTVGWIKNASANLALDMHGIIVRAPFALPDRVPGSGWQCGRDIRKKR